MSALQDDCVESAVFEFDPMCSVAVGWRGSYRRMSSESFRLVLSRHIFSHRTAYLYYQ